MSDSLCEGFNIRFAERIEIRINDEEDMAIKLREDGMSKVRREYKNIQCRSKEINEVSTIIQGLPKHLPGPDRQFVVKALLEVGGPAPRRTLARGRALWLRTGS